MDLKHTVLTVAVALFTVTSVYGQAGVSTQADLDNIAASLEVKIIMKTQHFTFGDHGVQISLKNTNAAKILDKSDWAIQFSMKNKLFKVQSFWTGYGLEVRKGSGCNYVIRPDPNAKPAFKGLNSNEYVAFTVPGEGLSVFKSDVYPNFIVFAGDGLTARTIQSTSSDSLSFVYIHSSNATWEDPSLMNGVRRAITTADIIDQNGVPKSTVMPAPMSVVLAEPVQVVDLNATGAWYIWAAPQVSDTFQARLRASIEILPDMAGRVQSFTPTAQNKSPPLGAGVIYLVFKKLKPQSTDDYYKLATGRKGASDFIHITAHTEQGFANALSSLESIWGLFILLPHITIEDDARFGVRSVMLDVTKNFFPAHDVIKFLQLMRMYKLNNLVLNLADDYAWRLEMPASMDFGELTSYASKRCFDEATCLPPNFGSGATSSTSGSGFYTTADFTSILTEAEKLRIQVTPKFNFMGGMNAAKKAAHKRYMRLMSTKPAEADRLHIMTASYPTIAAGEASTDTCYTAGLLDPCHSTTQAFITDVLTGVKSIYTTAGVSLEEFHAGGDEMTRFLNRFANCVDPQRKMINMILGALDTTSLRVNEEAVTDPQTGFCLTQSGTYRPAKLTVDFWNIVPSPHDTWGLTADQLNYLNAPVSPVVNGTATDPLKPINFTSLGDAPWSKAYKCANADYNVILSPNSFFSLDSPYELDFKEVGNRRSDQFYPINLHRMMMFEPYNYYANMDMGSDRYMYLTYRLCQVWNCPEVDPNKRSNIKGMMASIDTAVIRSNETLYHLATPRMLLFAEKAWRNGIFENILNPANMTSLVNMSLVAYRSQALDFEITNFLNCYAYKESGRLDEMGYRYRVTRPGVSIYFGVPFRVTPPYAAVVKVDVPDVEVQFRDRIGADRSWKQMFWKNDTTGQIYGGYNFSFPLTSQQDIDIRVMSTDGQRGSLPTRLTGDTKYLLPRELPADLRADTCTSILEPWTTSLENINTTQWNQILTNMANLQQDEGQFQQSRVQQLTAAFNAHKQQYDPNSQLNLQIVLMQIQQLMMTGVDPSTLAPTDIKNVIYKKEQEIMNNREQALQARMMAMHQAYLNCPNAAAEMAAAAADAAAA